LSSCPFSSSVGVDILSDIPLDTSIMEASDEGHPIVISAGNNAVVNI